MYLLIYTLITTHITILCVTLYLHRSQSHRAVEFHPVLAHLMRFYLWLTTGMITKEWVAIHRKHHRFCERDGDPHSPHIFGIWKVLLGGVGLYRSAARDRKAVEAYGTGTPNDWVEKTVYTPFNYFGIFLLLILDLFLFGAWGSLVWVVQMLWVPIHAAGIINGLGHWWGYRNYELNDKSKNIFPIDFYIGGEMLHHNHHEDPASAKFSKKWWEFDIGWFWIKLLEFLRLAKLKGS